MTRKYHSTFAGYGFIFPSLILVAIFLLYPIGFVIYISFHKWGILGTPQFVGLDNYIAIFNDDRFWRAALNTVYYMVLAVPTQIGLGLLLAVLVNRKDIGSRGLFRTVYFIPLAISFVAAGIIFKWMLITTPLQGFAPALFERMGLNFPQWQTTQPAWAMVMIALMNTWKSAGYAMVIYLAGLQGINKDYYEAASIDGVRSEWQLFRYITWPLLAPTTFLLVVSTIIFTVRGFEPIFVMTQGGPAGATTTLVYYVYQKFPNTMGISSAAATFLLVAILLLTLVQYLINRRSESYY
ncbi:MAG: sugar ABC transporter permease [Anaerolineae bacterium]|nr:sugar ABC transporter permease [Anaerolineae bacterium]